MVRRERPRPRAAVERLEDRRLDFEVPARVEVGADRRDHPGPRHEHGADIRMHREIGIPLAVALLRVAEAGMPDDVAVDRLFLAQRERPERLGQQLDRLDPDGRLTRPCPEDRPCDADYVAEVEAGEQVIRITQRVFAEVELDLATLIGEMRECGLAMSAP